MSFVRDGGRPPKRHRVPVLRLRVPATLTPDARRRLPVYRAHADVCALRVLLVADGLTHMDPHDLSSLFRQYKQMAEAALAHVGEEAFFAHHPPDNSLAVIVQHMAGNLHSRFTDFWATDGEKPSRNREAEFIAPSAGRQALMHRWEAGWSVLLNLLDNTSAEDLNRIVYLRGQPLTARQAFLRQLAHYAYHVGQVVQQARRVAGPAWKSLW